MPTIVLFISVVTKKKMTPFSVEVIPPEKVLVETDDDNFMLTLLSKGSGKRGKTTPNFTSKRAGILSAD